MDHPALSQLSKDDLIALLLAQGERIAELERRLLETGVYDGVGVALAPGAPQLGAAAGAWPAGVVVRGRCALAVC